MAVDDICEQGLGTVHTEPIFCWNRILCVSSDRPDGAGESGDRNRTFLKPPSEVVSKLSGPMRFRVRIRVDAWNANDDVISPPPAGGRQSCVEFFIYYFICIIFVALNKAPWHI